MGGGAVWIQEYGMPGNTQEASLNASVSSLGVGCGEFAKARTAN
jgi:hypothetical protein